MTLPDLLARIDPEHRLGDVWDLYALLDAPGGWYPGEADKVLRGMVPAALLQLAQELERLQGEVGYCEGCGAWLGENPLKAEVERLKGELAEARVDNDKLDLRLARALGVLMYTKRVVDTLDSADKVVLSCDLAEWRRRLDLVLAPPAEEAQR